MRPPREGDGKVAGVEDVGSLEVVEQGGAARMSRREMGRGRGGDRGAEWRMKDFGDGGRRGGR